MRGEIVDRVRVLRGFAGPHELGNAVRIVAVEMADGGFGDHDAGGVHDEIVAAVDEAGQAVHHHAMALGGSDVEDDRPALAIQVARPVIVRDDDFAILGIAAGGHEGAAMLGRDQRGGVLRGVLFVVLLDVVLPLHRGIQRNHVPDIELHALRVRRRRRCPATPRGTRARCAATSWCGRRRGKTASLSYCRATISSVKTFSVSSISAESR